MAKQQQKTPLLGGQIFTSEFVNSQNGGVMAKLRIGGRIVFPDSRAEQPKADGTEYSFQICGQNPRETVYFATLVARPATVAAAAPKTETSARALTIATEPSGRLIAVGPGRVASAKPRRTIRHRDLLLNYRHGSRQVPTHDSNWPAELPWGQVFGDEDSEDPYALEHEASLLELALPNRVLACVSCGDIDCACDGTHTGHHRAGHNTADHVMA